MVQKRIRHEQVDSGTNANQIVVLDSLGRLPAVDGTQLIGVSGGDIVDDLTPQLGGNLDLNSFNLFTLAVGSPDTNTDSFNFVGGSNAASAGTFTAGGATIQGGAGTNGNDGGPIVISGGASTGGYGGDVSITSGNGTSTVGVGGGNVSLTSGDNTAAAGAALAGDITLTTGDSTTSTSGIGGDIRIESGTGKSRSGNITITSGDAVGSGAAGDIFMTTGAGDTGFASAAPGIILLQTGNGGTGNHAGADINLIAGDGGSGGTTGLGGDIILQTGDAGTSTEEGGRVIILLGDSKGGVGEDGYVELKMVDFAASKSSPSIHFNEKNGLEYIALKAPDAITTSRTWTLPQDDPTVVAGQFLTTNASGELSFDPASAVSALNDLTDVIVAGSPAISGQVLKFNGTNWVSADDAGVFTLDANETLFAGTGAGGALTTAVDCFLAGNNAGQLLSTGSANIAIGDLALSSAVGVSDCIAIGRNALKNTTSSNDIGIGSSAGYRMSGTSNRNIVIGLLSGMGLYGTGNIDNIIVGGSAGGTVANTTTAAVGNVGIGHFALRVLGGGDNNVALGESAASAITTGSDNVAIGRAAQVGTTASDNITIGQNAGSTLTTGTHNVNIGAYSGYSINGSNKLSIHSSGAQTNTPLIGGDFATPAVTINGDLTVTGTFSGGGTSALNDLTDVIVAGSPAISGQVLTFNGTNWVNADTPPATIAFDDITDVTITTPAEGSLISHNGAGQFIDVDVGANGTLLLANSGAVGGVEWGSLSAATEHEWIHCAGGGDFGIVPVSSATGTDAAIAIGDGATAADFACIGIGRLANATFDGCVAIGESAKANTGVDATAIGQGTNANNVSVAIGNASQATATRSVAIGSSAKASTNTQAIAIGRQTNAYGLSSISMGSQAETVAAASFSIAVGYHCESTLANQVVIGSNFTAGLPYVNSNVARSVRLGFGSGTVPNFLHLFDDGKLELYGDEAMYIVPKYAAGTVANGQEGGMIYDSTAKKLKVHDGSSFQDVHGNLNDLTDVVVSGSPAAVSSDVLTFDGTNWVNSTPSASGEAYVDILSSGTLPSAGGTDCIAIGNNASTNSEANSIAIGTNASGTRAYCIAIGKDTGHFSGTTNTSSIAIGWAAKTNGGDDISIGTSTTSESGYANITIGDTARSSGTAARSITMGWTANADKAKQIAVGAGMIATSITLEGGTDVAYSTKIGYGVNDTNKNILHLFSKGKLELYGDEAQYVFPNYITGNIPATTIEGGTVWDSTTKELKVYDGSVFTAIGGGSSKPQFESVTPTGSPPSEIINTTVPTVAIGGSPQLAGVQVFRNGMLQDEGVDIGSPATITEDFVVSGANQITFAPSILTAGDKIKIFAFT